MLEMKSKVEPMPDSDVTIDYMIDNLWIVGSPEDAVKQITDLYEQVGGFGTLLVMGHEWKPEKNWQKSMRLLYDEVIPRLKRLGI